MAGFGLISLLFENPILFVLVAIGLVISITIHEFAHAYTADYLGDPTPRYQGRVTLDPRAHLDPVGTLLIFLFGFGWGKPVVFDPYNLKDKSKDIAMISFAGPLSNLILATVISLAIGILNLPEIAIAIAMPIIFVNVMLAIFNLVPVAPLDGSKIINIFLPKATALEYEIFMNRYGTLVLIALLLPWTSNGSPISYLISPVIEIVLSLLSLLMQI